VVQLAKAATGELPPDLVMKIVLLNIPSLLSLLLPIGFFIGILLVLGRLTAGAELIVLLSSGFSLRQLITLVLKVAIVIALLAFGLTLWAIPQAINYQKDLLAEAHLDLLASVLKPGQFIGTDDGKTILFVQSLLPDKSEAKNVFLVQKPRSGVGGSPWVVVSAKGAKRVTDKTTGQDYVVLLQGYRYEGTPGQRDYTIVRFSKFGMLLRSKAVVLDHDVRMRSTRMLLSSHGLKDIAELQWRVALPVSVLIVAIMAVALCDVSPRRNRYANCLPGIVVVIVYTNCLILGRAWLKVGDVPAYVGLWWVHLLALVFSLVLFSWRLSWFRQIIFHWKKKS